MLNGNIRRNQGESSCLDANVDAEPLEIKTGAKDLHCMGTHG